MFQLTHVDHTAFRTNDMERTVQFYCGVLGMPLLQAMQGGEAGPTARRYVLGVGQSNRLVFFDGYESNPKEGSTQHLDHMSLHVDTQQEFDESYQRLQEHHIEVTGLVERVWGKTFYFKDPNGIVIQISLDTTVDTRVCDDPNPVPSAEKYLVRK